MINWVEEAGESLSDEPQEDEIPEITEIDELQTFVGHKKNKFWIWTVVNHQKKGILLWNLGARSHETFEPIWQIIKCWHSFWYVTRTRMRSSRLAAVCANALRWKVYPMFIQPEDHLVSKTYMTRAVRKLEVTSSCAPSACFAQVEGENTRLRHYLARLHRQTLCYSKSLLLLKCSLRLLLHYLRFGTIHISV